MPRARTIVAILLAVLGGVALALAYADRRPGPAPAALDHGEVVRVVDGDTVVVRVAGGRTERVRLVGIDAPESVAPDRPVECFGPEASAALAELLPAGSEVRLERDVEARDRFGRLLAYVFRQPDGLFVNEALAAGGSADGLSFPPNTAYEAAVSAAVRTARAEGAGLWGACR